MSKDDWVYVKHMLDQVDVALRHVAGVDRARFDADELLRLGLTYVVQSIGEAARHVSQEFRDRQGAIPWKQIVGMRHKLVHDYVHVDYDIVWETATRHLPPLRTTLIQMIEAEEGSASEGVGE
jgi:uncharacterized protein with HEPN domain